MEMTTTLGRETEWQRAMRRLETARRIMDNYHKDHWEPAYERREAFEQSRGLVAPGNGRNATAGYFEAVHLLLAANPEYNIPDDVADIMETLTDAFAAAQTAVMETPAPDLAALRWKLDHTLENEDGNTPAWSFHYVKQMLADIDRLLPRGEA